MAPAEVVELADAEPVAVEFGRCPADLLDLFFVEGGCASGRFGSRVCEVALT